MQPLLDGPRASLTTKAVKRLLQSHDAIRITFGADGLDGSFGTVADLSPYLASGSQIISDVSAQINRTGSFTVSGDVVETQWNWLSGYLKPWMELTNQINGDVARFYLGVYVLTSPQRQMGTTPAEFIFQGYDLKYRLAQDIGDSFEVQLGADPVQAAAALIARAIPGSTTISSGNGQPLTNRLSWPLDAARPHTYLEIIETLLASTGYRKLWVDWNGAFRIEPYVNLASATSEWTLDTEATDAIVAADRKQDVDIFNVPNWFRFVQANAGDTPVEGQTMITWLDNSNSDPGSILNRGYQIRHVEQVASTTPGDLAAVVSRRVADMISPGETFQITMQPFPIMWHFDVVDYIDPSLQASLPASVLGQRKLVSTQWTLPLGGDGDMSVTLQTISDQDSDSALADIVQSGG